MAIPHKHAAVIKAWADGAEIECRQKLAQGEFTEWTSVPAKTPAWDATEYRVKPEPTAREYPKLDEAAIKQISDASIFYLAAVREIAPMVIKHAVDAQLVIPFSEVQETARGLAKNREMNIAEAVRFAASKQTDGAWDSQAFCGAACTIYERIKSLDLPAIIASIKD